MLMTLVGRFTTLTPAWTPEALRVVAGTTYLGSNEKAVRELGFTARPLEEGMAQTIEHELRALGYIGLRDQPPLRKRDVMMTFAGRPWV